MKFIVCFGTDWLFSKIGLGTRRFCEFFISTCTDARDLPRILWSVNLRVVRKCGFGFGLQMAALGRAWTVRGWIRQSTETRSWFRCSSPSNHCPCNGSLRTSGAWKITTVVNYPSSSGSPLKLLQVKKWALSKHKSRKISKEYTLTRPFRQRLSLRQWWSWICRWNRLRSRSNIGPPRCVGTTSRWWCNAHSRSCGSPDSPPEQLPTKNAYWVSIIYLHTNLYGSLWLDLCLQVSSNLLDQPWQLAPW